MVVRVLKVKQGISAPAVTSIPETWDRVWFRNFITNFLVNADIRNAQTGPGLVISGNVSGNNTSAAGNSNVVTIGTSPIPNNTVLGNVSGMPGEPQAITQDELTTLINTFTTTLSGAVPAPGTVAGKFLEDNGTWAVISNPFPANPTALVGLTAVNGTATTYIRSDGAPAISQAIAPTWTSKHIFQNQIQVSSATSAIPVTVNGPVGNWGEVIQGSTTASNSFGLLILAGTNNSDNAIQITDQGNTRSFLAIRGNGTTLFGNTGDNPLYHFQGTGLVTVDGQTQIGATASTARLTVAETGTVYTGYFQGGATTGSSFGILLNAGTNSADNAIQIADTTNARSFLAIRGNGTTIFGNAGDNPPYNFIGTGLMSVSGSIVIGAPTGGNKGVGTLNATGLFINGAAVGTGTGSVTSISASTGITLTPNPITTTGTVAVNQAFSPTWTGNHTFTPGSGVATTLNGFTNQIALVIHGASTTSQSFGATIAAGTNSSDFALQVSDQTNTRSFLAITGAATMNFGNAGDNPNFTFLGTGQTSVNGAVVIGSPTGGNKGTGTVNATGLFVNGVAVGTGSGSVTSITSGTGITLSPSTITTTGSVSINLGFSPTWTGNHTFTPGSGVGVTVNGGTTNFSLFIQGSATTSQSRGLLVLAGTNSSDSPLQISDTTNTRSFLAITGAGVGSFSNGGDKAAFNFAGPIGINGTTAPAKPTVTGSRSANAALASLLTALASYGILTDSSTP